MSTAFCFSPWPRLPVRRRPRWPRSATSTTSASARTIHHHTNAFDQFYVHNGGPGVPFAPVPNGDLSLACREPTRLPRSTSSRG